MMRRAPVFAREAPIPEPLAGRAIVAGCFVSDSDGRRDRCVARDVGFATTARQVAI
jgi:hypothetical protein